MFNILRIFKKRDEYIHDIQPISIPFDMDLSWQEIDHLRVSRLTIYFMDKKYGLKNISLWLGKDSIRFDGVRMKITIRETNGSITKYTLSFAHDKPFSKNKIVDSEITEKLNEFLEGLVLDEIRDVKLQLLGI